MKEKVEETIIALCNWIQVTVEGYPTADELEALPAVVQGVAALYGTIKGSDFLSVEHPKSSNLDVGRMIDHAKQIERDVHLEHVDTKEKIKKTTLLHGVPQTVYVDKAPDQ